MTNLQSIMAEVSDRMRSDLATARAALTHTGLKGTANEEGVRRVVRQYFPRSLDVATGTIVDSTGAQSKQLDVVISDAARTPIFFEAAGTRVIPAECALAVIEVKADLTVAKLGGAYQNMRSVKGLTKKAFFEERGVLHHEHTLYGKAWHCWPTQFFIFAYESATLETLQDELNRLQQHDAPESRIDMICSLDRGVIMNQDAQDKFSALPSPGSHTFIATTKHALLLFYTMASLIVNQAQAPVFNILPYIEGTVFD